MIASRALPLAIIGGLAAGLLFAAILTGSFGGEILFWMAPLPLFVIGLRFGLQAIGIACLAGSVAVAAGEPALGLNFAALVALPAALLVWLALAMRGDRLPGAVLLGLTAIGLAGFAAASLLAAGAAGGLQGVVTGMIKTAVDAAAEQIPGMPAIAPDALDGVGFWLPGMIVVVWLIVFAGNGMLAQGLVSRFGGGLVATPTMASIGLPRLVSIAFGVSLAAMLAGSGWIAFAGVSVAEILSVPLMFGGLGVVHALLAQHPSRGFWLTAFYAVIMGFGLTIAVVVALGVIEEWARLRQRFAVPAPRGEE